MAEGSAAAVVRVFVADGCSAGSNASISLRGDVGPWGGLRYNAMRLEVLHHASRSDFRKVCGDNVRLGLLLAARKVPTAEAFHAFAQEVSGWPVESSLDRGVWKASVTVGGHTLAGARRSQRFGNATVYRRVDGADVAAEHFRVNGQPMFPLPPPPKGLGEE